MRACAAGAHNHTHSQNTSLLRICSTVISSLSVLSLMRAHTHTRWQIECLLMPYLLMATAVLPNVTASSREWLCLAVITSDPLDVVVGSHWAAADVFFLIPSESLLQPVVLLTSSDPPWLPLLRLVAVPLGRCLGVKDRVRIRAAANPKLENFYKRNSRRQPSQVCNTSAQTSAPFQKKR